MNAVPAHRVYVRQLWSQDWTLMEGLYANVFTEAVAPDMSTAEIQWNYGNVIPFGGQSFVVRTPQDLLNWFVKIEIDQAAGIGDTYTWHGIVTSDRRELYGDHAAQNLPAGMQFLQCHGMEFLLHKTQVDTSIVAGIDLDDVVVKRAIGFNLGGGDERTSTRYFPNCAPFNGSKGVRIFCDGLDLAGEWTPERIVRYLIAYHAPKDIVGVQQIPWDIDPAYNLQLDSLDWWKPTLQYQGRSLWEILNAVLPRHRLMSFRTTVLGDTVLLQPFSFAEADIVLPDGNVIRANPVQVAMDFDDSALAQNASVVSDVQPTFDRVIAKGERVEACWTMKSTDIIDDDWTPGQQTEYNGGAPEATGADEYVDIQLHRNFRHRDELFRVYRCFRVATGWNGQVDDDVVVIRPDAVTGNIGAVDTFWRPGLRFTNRLPLKLGIDYETITEDPEDNAPDGSVPEYRRPFAVGHAYVAGGGDGPYFYLDKPTATVGYADQPEQGERQWAVTVRPQDDGLGVILDVHGAPQHVLAHDEFSPADDADTNDWAGELDWKKFRITVSMLLDSFCYGQWPDPMPPQPGSYVRELSVDVPNKELIYVVPDTVVDVTSEGDLVLSAGGFIKDDRDELVDIARLSYQWYSTTRRALDVTLRTLHAEALPGYLVTTLGAGNTEIEINSVITQVSWNTRANTVTYRTQFAQMDFASI